MGPTLSPSSLALASIFLFYSKDLQQAGPWPVELQLAPTQGKSS